MLVVSEQNPPKKDKKRFKHTNINDYIIIKSFYNRKQLFNTHLSFINTALS